MSSLRALGFVFASLSAGWVFSACGARTLGLDLGDAAVDGQPTTTATPTTTTTTTVTPTTTTTTTPPCPTYRPIRNTPCFTGQSCYYPCAPGELTAIRATCPEGRWRISDAEYCDDPGTTCNDCVMNRCDRQVDACQMPAASDGCNALIDCLNNCDTAECQNECITSSTSSEGKDLIQCVVNECYDQCSG
jgi:hypothetical protein